MKGQDRETENERDGERERGGGGERERMREKNVMRKIVRESEKERMKRMLLNQVAK